MARGRLRVYLGAAPGVGKTYAMLGEGHRRARARHRRRRRLRRDPRPARTPPSMVAGLEVVPAHGDRATAARRFDGDGRRRRPGPAPRGRPGRRARPHQRARARGNEKRWQDVDELLAAGIDVITTVNIQHLESLNDVVEPITGVPQRETVPDEVVRARRPDRARRHDARRRCAAGWPTATSTPPEKVDAALAQLLPGRQPHRAARARPAVARRPGRRGPRALPRRARHRPAPGRPASGSSSRSPAGPEGETLLRRGARIAGARRRAASCSPSTSPAATGSTGATPDALAAQRAARRGASAGPSTRSSATTSPRRCSTSPAASTPPRSSSAPRRRGRLARLLRPGVGDAGRRAAPATSTSTSSPTTQAGRGRRGRGRRALSRRRLVAGWLLAPCGPLAARPCCCSMPRRTRRCRSTVLLLPARSRSSSPWSAGSGPALVGGRGRRACCSTTSSPRRRHAHDRRARERPRPRRLRRWSPPRGASWSTARPPRPQQAVARPARGGDPRRRSPAACCAGRTSRRPRCSTGAARPSGSTVAWRCSSDRDDRRPWTVVAAVGLARRRGIRCRRRRASRSTTSTVLVLVGRPLPADRPAGARRLRRAGRARPRTRAAAPAQAAEADAAGRATTVPHGPARRGVARPAHPAGRASRPRVVSLRRTTSTWSARGPRPSCSTTIEDSADRLDALVDNLLDLSPPADRRACAAQRPRRRSSEVVHRRAGRAARPVAGRSVDAGDELPLVPPTPGCSSGSSPTSSRTPCATPAGAGASSPSATVGDRRASSASSTAARASPDEAEDRIFAPFQRLGDAPAGDGVGPRPGRGPRPDRGHGRRRSTAEDTPGGGLTMVARSLPAAAGRAARPPGGRPMTRVLVVDDDGPHRAAPSRINLRARGYEVDVAADGRDGAASSPPSATPTSSSSTSACPTSTASR